MPRFYFNIAGNDTMGEDESGIHLPSMEAARCHAARLAAQLKKVGLREAEIVVGDQDGAPLFGVRAAGRRPVQRAEARGCRI
jgi:hypothetical protein